MKICVFGLWHLGTVTAACLASAGHTVVGLDLDEENIQNLQKGRLPIFEPGLESIVGEALKNKSLRFTSSIEDALSFRAPADAPQVVWITFDTPVDQNDVADVNFVFQRVEKLFPYLQQGMVVLISSQLPVGTTRKLEQSWCGANPGKEICFAYSPENLRLGKAIEAFTKPDRVIVGFRSEVSRERIAELFNPLGVRLEWMSVESAEMTKHAINAFLATSVAFINELAGICEHVGADAKEVERGLKTEARIGPKAYLSPGPAFAGGTLARDISFLTQIGNECKTPTNLIAAVRESNDAHKNWSRRKLMNLFTNLQGRRICILGLTYKPGTDTLRRSMSIELCAWLAEMGAVVQAHDPAVKGLPADLSPKIQLHANLEDALHDADALVLGTEWPDYLNVNADLLVSRMKTPIILDPSRFMAKALSSDPRIRYATIGKPVC